MHHKQGPANNSANALEWVSVEENAKAKKYFNSDGTRKVKVHARRPNAKKSPKPKVLKEKDELKPDKLKTSEDANLPDRDEYIPNTETLAKKIRYITKTSKEVSRAYQETRKIHKNLSSKTFAKLFQDATGKKLNS